MDARRGLYQESQVGGSLIFLLVERGFEGVYLHVVTVLSSFFSTDNSFYFLTSVGYK